MTHVNQQFWQAVADATNLVMTSGARRVDGEGFKVYTVPSGITRIDIPAKQPNQGGQHDRTRTEA